MIARDGVAALNKAGLVLWNMLQEHPAASASRAEAHDAFVELDITVAAFDALHWPDPE